MARKRKSGRAPIVSARTSIRPRFSDPVSLVDFGDRRRFHPELVKPAFGVNIGATRLVLRPSAKRPRLTYKSPIGFAVPDKVMVCVRRKRRRQVIFAKGKSGGGNRRGKRNFWSKVTCR